MICRKLSMFSLFLVPEGVYAVKHLQTHTKFGPLMGELVKTMETEGLFPEWRVGVHLVIVIVIYVKKL